MFNRPPVRGYGTHAAGNLGGTDWGVAKQVHLVAVRVLDCSGNGFISEVVAGIDWVTAHAQHPAVVDLDTIGDVTVLIDAAVRRSIGSGLTWVVPAGDGNDKALDACDYSPSGIGEAIVVSASTYSDEPLYYAGYGPCVDLYAPGTDIPGPWIGSDVALASRSGTSLAAPHVAGAAALIRQQAAVRVLPGRLVGLERPRRHHRGRPVGAVQPTVRHHRGLHPGSGRAHVLQVLRRRLVGLRRYLRLSGRQLGKRGSRDHRLPRPLLGEAVRNQLLTEPAISPPMNHRPSTM